MSEIQHNGIMSCPHGPQMSDYDLTMHMRELSLQLATDARRIGAPNSEVREKLCVQSEALAQVVRRFAEYEAEEDSSNRIRASMQSILDAMAVTLKGPHPENGRHSWHDLPECTQRLVEECHAWRERSITMSREAE